MNIGTPEERLAELKRLYLHELNLEENLIMTVNNPNIDKTKIQNYISQIETSKHQRKYYYRRLLKELIDIFPHLVDTLDIVHQAILNELNFLEEVVDLTPRNFIRRTNKAVPKFYRRPNHIRQVGVNDIGLELGRERKSMWILLKSE
jgi:hypothetical protein